MPNAIDAKVFIAISPACRSLEIRSDDEHIPAGLGTARLGYSQMNELAGVRLPGLLFCKPVVGDPATLQCGFDSSGRVASDVSHTLASGADSG